MSPRALQKSKSILIESSERSSLEDDKYNNQLKMSPRAQSRGNYENVFCIHIKMFR